MEADTDKDLMKYSLILLRFHQMIPPKHQELRPGKVFWFKFVLLITLALVFTSSIVASIYYAFVYEAWDIMNGFLAYVTSFAGCIYIFTVGAVTHRAFHVAFSHLLDLREFGVPADFRDTCTFLNRFSLAHYVYVNCAFITQFIYGLARRKSCEEEYRRRGYPVTCGFIESMLPMQVASVGQIVALCLWEMLSCFFVMQGAGLCAYTFFETNVYLVSRVRHLNALLAAMFDPPPPGHEASGADYRERFRECVRHHTYIVQLAQKLNAAYRKVMFVHVLLSAAVFGLLANLIIQKFALPDILHLGAWIYTTFLACLGGQMTINECERITTSIYNSRWYEMEVGLQKDAMFMLFMSQTSLCMHAGPFGILSFPLFAVIMKTSYSYMALVQTS